MPKQTKSKLFSGKAAASEERRDQTQVAANLPSSLREERQHRIPPVRTATPMNVVAFVGENENGILKWSSQDLIDTMAPYGVIGHVINMLDDNWQKKFEFLLNEGMLFSFGIAGIGAGLKLGGQIIWDAIKTPFISILADSPCYLPLNHRVPASFVANGYMFDDWLKFQRKLIKSPQISSLLPLGTGANPMRDNVTWSDRQHRMVFVKTSSAPETHQTQWKTLPKRFRAVLEDAASAALRQGVGDITDIFLQCLDHHNLYLEQRPEVLFGLMCYVDRYVRDYRSTAMVKGLLNLPVDIIGRGWDYMATPGSRARFYAPIDATLLPTLYANTQFLLNTMPNVSTRTHERVLSGFAAKCCVVTNENDDMRTRFGPLPSYFGVDTEAANLSASLASLYYGTERYEDRLQPALDLVQAEFNINTFVVGIMELVAEVHAAAGTEFAGFGY